MKKRLHWKFYSTSDAKTSTLLYHSAARITEIVQSAFSVTPYEANLEVSHLLLTSDCVCLLLSDEGIIYGVASLSFPESRLMGRRFVWENKIAIMRDEQTKGKNYGTKHFYEAISAYLGNDGWGFLGCFTQNPVLIQSYSSLGQVTYPITNWYTGPMGVRLVSYLNLEVQQYKTRMAATEDRDVNIDSVHGIVRRMFNGPMVSASQFEKSIALMRRLKRVGFSAEKGDAITLISKLP